MQATVIHSVPYQLLYYAPNNRGVFPQILFMLHYVIAADEHVIWYINYYKAPLRYYIILEYLT